MLCRSSALRRGSEAALRRAFGAALLAAAMAVACSRAPRATPAPVPAPAPRARTSASVARAPLPPANPRLPPVPEVRGPLDIKVVYPPEHSLITSRDSNFIFGSVGDGTAGLRINGALVPVWPDGAFLGWLPNPPPDAQWYDIVAYTATDTARLRFPVRTLAALPPREPSTTPVSLVTPPRAAVVRNDVADRFASDTDNLVIGRPTPTGTYHWFLFGGTPVTLLETRDGMARLALDNSQDIWVARGDVVASPRALATPTVRRLRSATVTSTAHAVSLILRASVPPAYLVEEGDHDLTVTLYATAPPRSSALRTSDPLVESITMHRDGQRTVYRVTLRQRVYGYLALYERGAFRLVVRRPPVTNASSPLAGLTIVVDPGHPPIGATGPTGLWEPVATLAVGLKLRDLLQARGAHVVMTRTGPGPVPLYDRPVIARRANANALVSIHLNADADGQDPFRDNGTGTYYFHPHSKPLATAIQQSLVPQLGLRDRGVFFQNLAVARPTWFPAVLAEGLFIIMPDQEAAIKTPQYQEAYARGVADGLERYFAQLAR